MGSLKVLFSGGLLVWLYNKGVLDLVILKKMLDPSILISSLFLLVLSFYFATWRWQMLLKVQGISLSLFDSLKLNLMGLFFNYIVPGGVGGDVVKGYYIVKENPHNRMGAAVSVLLDRVMGLYAMLLMALVAMLSHLSVIQTKSELKYIAQGLVVLFLGFTLGLLLAFSKKFRHSGWQERLKNKKWGTKLISAYEAVYSYSHHIGVLGKVILGSLVAQTLGLITLWWLGQKLGFAEIPLSIYLVVGPLGFMVTALPISPAGVGVGQMAFFVLFNLFLGRETQAGPLVITAFQVLNFILSLSGIWFFVQRKTNFREVESALGS